MEKGKIFRKMLVAMGLLTMVAPLSLTVVACNDTQDEARTTDDELVVDAINGVTYSKQFILNSKVNKLKSSITSEFIKTKITGKIKHSFENEFFVLNKIVKENGIELTDDDFKTVQTINAKIIYNYAEFKDQITNLEIEIQIDRIPLSNVLKDFYFTDDKNVEGFLDANDLDLIAKQIRDYLGESLTSDNLHLKNQTINSIQLVTTTDSENYIGEITLTWNLKLFEVWTSVTTEEVEDDFLQKGLLGYFYLKEATHQIRYIDIYNLKSGQERIINKWFDEYHSFYIGNNKFQFLGNWLTSEVEKEYDFRIFDIDFGSKFRVKSPEPENIKFFENNKWRGFLRKEDGVDFDKLGRVES